MKTIKKALFLLICLVCLMFTSQTSLFSQDRADEIDHLMSAYYDLEQFNGTILVAERGEIIFKKGYGLANMEWDIPNAPDTKMRLGSITKQFTSMLIMQYVEDGKIDLQDVISKYLTDYRSETGNKVTVHHLLTHTSGIPSYTSLPNFFNEISRDPYTLEAFISEFCSGDLEFEPGTQFSYNNSGYFLLGAIIEKVSGQSYEDALSQQILDPLGMKNSGYDHHGTILKKRATGYSKTPQGYSNSPYLNMGLPYAAGSMYSTVEDLYLWDRALYTEQLLSATSKRIMFTPYLNHYAYGWGVNKVFVDSSKDSLNLVAHGGGINGFNTLITRLVDDQHLVVLLNNTGGANLTSMDRNIRNILYGLPYELPKKSIASQLYEKLEEENLAAAITLYEDLKENHPDEYNFMESELNLLGYRLLSENRLEDAIGIFQLNVKMFTQSFNVYDSLGEAYMENGQNEYAIKNYQRSLELNPNNTNAKEMLKTLQ